MKLTLCKLTSTLMMLYVAYGDQCFGLEISRHEQQLAAIETQRDDVENGKAAAGAMELIEARRDVIQNFLHEEELHHQNMIKDEEGRHQLQTTTEEARHQQQKKDVQKQLDEEINTHMKPLLAKFNLPDYDDDSKCIEFPGVQQSGDFHAGQMLNLADDFTDIWHYHNYSVLGGEWAGYQLNRVKGEQNLWRGTNAIDSGAELVANGIARTQTVDIRITKDGDKLECKFTSQARFLVPENQMSWHSAPASWDKKMAEAIEEGGEAEWLLMTRQNDGSWSTDLAYVLKVETYNGVWQASASTKEGKYMIQIADA